MSEKQREAKASSFSDTARPWFTFLLLCVFYLFQPPARPKEQASSRTSVGRRKERTTLPRRLILVEIPFCLLASFPSLFFPFLLSLP